MTEILLAFAWCWFVLGIVSGAVLGLGFHRPGFMGGYGSWRRRLARLGHIAFFGTGLLALAMGLTVAAAGPLAEGAVRAAGVATLVGAATMPPVCFLAAWRRGWRHLFAVPVAGLGGGVLLFAGVLLAAAF